MEEVDIQQLLELSATVLPEQVWIQASQEINLIGRVVGVTLEIQSAKVVHVINKLFGSGLYN